MSQDELITDLWEAGTLGVVEVGETIRAYFADGTDLEVLRQKYDVATETVNGEVPQSTDNAGSEPVMVGSSFVVVEENCAGEDYGGRHVIRLKARTSFGSGKHESTQLVMEALESLRLRGSLVLDVGCGTAIIAETARCLGARQVIACDSDFDATTTARENFPYIATFHGSVDAVASASVDVVVANISARVIDELASDLCRVCRHPNSFLILSGFIGERGPRAFRPGVLLQRGDWNCWISSPQDLVSLAIPTPVLQPFDKNWWQ